MDLFITLLPYSDPESLTFKHKTLSLKKKKNTKNPTVLHVCVCVREVIGMCMRVQVHAHGGWGHQVSWCWGPGSCECPEVHTESRVQTLRKGSVQSLLLKSLQPQPGLFFWHVICLSTLVLNLQRCCSGLFIVVIIIWCMFIGFCVFCRVAVSSRFHFSHFVCFMRAFPDDSCPCLSVPPATVWSETYYSNTKGLAAALVRRCNNSQ